MEDPILFPNSQKHRMSHPRLFGAWEYGLPSLEVKKKLSMATKKNKGEIQERQQLPLASASGAVVRQNDHHYDG